MTEKEVIMEVLGFFIIPYKPKKDKPLYYEPIEDEQEAFQKILNFRLVSQREDERQYELKNKIERLEFLKQKMIEFEKPSFYHIAKIDRFIKFCTEIVVNSGEQELSPYGKLITENFNNLNNGWQYAFLTEDDFNKYVTILTDFFEGNSGINEVQVIKLKNGSMTAVAKVLNDIQRELSEVALKSNKEYFNIIRLLSVFKDKNDDYIYRALTK